MDCLRGSCDRNKRAPHVSVAGYGPSTLVCCPSAQFLGAAAADSCSGVTSLSMGNALSDSSRNFRKDLDSLVDAAKRDATCVEARVPSILRKQTQQPHHLVCKDNYFNAFVRLAQLGSIDALEHALSLARCGAGTYLLLLPRLAQLALPGARF